MKIKNTFLSIFAIGLAMRNPEGRAVEVDLRCEEVKG